MKPISYILIALFLFSCNSVKYGVVKRCIDGDTIVMEDNTHIRLAEIDCLELSQPHGLEAKQFVENLILGRRVKLVIKGSDKYKRKIAEIYLNDVWINEVIVKNGMAYVYRRYGSRKLYNEEQEAKRNKIGLWAYDDVIPPFIWREEHKHN